MRIENLTEGMVIKNYKDLCGVLEVEVKGGDSKKAQLKEFERYFEYEKQGNKFVIREVYDMPKDKIENRTGNNKVPYIQYIEKLILDLLVQDLNKGKVCLSKNKLFKELKMINDSYGFCKSRIPKLAKFTDIEKETIEEWYLSTDSTLKGNVEKALDNLKSQSLILWSNEISVCKIDALTNNGMYDINKRVTLDQYDEEIIEIKVSAGFTYNFREGTEDEKRFIIHTEREVMKEMGFDNKQTIIRCSMWDTFKDRINKIIIKELNINFYYSSYKILFNEDHIQEKYEELLDLLLTKEEREQNQSELNMAIIERLNNNTQKKQNRALKETESILGNIKNDKLKRRVDDNYIDDNNKLIETLIYKDAKKIRNNIKRIKLTI